jgi:hypothetical protein
MQSLRAPWGRCDAVAMSNDREGPYPAYDLGLEAACRAYCGKDCNIRLTDEMIKEVVEVYCSLGPDPRSRKVKAACTFEALCRITQTTKEDWERDFGQRLSSDLAEFSAGFFEGVNAEQRRRFFAARRH